MADKPRRSARVRHLVLVGDVTTPLPAECLACYVWRMLDDAGCNATLRWAIRWRDARAPRATALERRLAARGGFCDCELFLNVWVPTSRGRSYTEEADPVDPGPCRGVRRGSSKPCVGWVGGRV